MAAFLTRNAVGKKVQFALRGDFGIQLAQAAGGGIARIGKRLLAVVSLTLVECGKIGFQHQYFAADFDEFGDSIAVQSQRNIGDGFGVLGDIFAGCPVAACGGA